MPHEDKINMHENRFIINPHEIIDIFSKMIDISGDTNSYIEVYPVNFPSEEFVAFTTKTRDTQFSMTILNKKFHDALPYYGIAIDQEDAKRTILLLEEDLYNIAYISIEDVIIFSIVNTEFGAYRSVVCPYMVKREKSNRF